MRHENRISSRDFATELVEGYIADHVLRPGDRLPSERDLCEMWELNRTTLHSAIARLVDRGILRARVGSGTFVAAPKLVQNLQDLRGIGEAAVYAGRDPGIRLLGADIIEADKTLTQKLHVLLGAKVFILRRLRFVDGYPVAVETTHVNVKLCPGIEQHDFNKDSLFRIMHEVYGLEPESGDEKLSITKLDEQESELFCMPVGTPAFFQTGVLIRSDGVPLEYFKNVVLSQRIQFSCVLTR